MGSKAKVSAEILQTCVDHYTAARNKRVVEQRNDMIDAATREHENWWGWRIFKRPILTREEIRVRMLMNRDQRSEWDMISITGGRQFVTIRGIEKLVEYSVDRVIELDSEDTWVLDWIVP